MKIAYIVPSLAQFGPVVVVNDLVKQMIENSHYCIVYYFDEKKKQSMVFNCPTVRINAKEAINFTEYDVVHSHGFRPDRYVAKFREYSGKTKYVTTLHNYVFQDLKYKYNILIAQLFGRIWMNQVAKLDTVITLSKDALLYYSKIINKRVNLTYAYNTRSIDTNEVLNNDEITKITKFKGNSTLIGVIGVLNKRKGIDNLIKAIDNLPNYKLLVVGDGEDCLNLLTLVNRLGVNDRCLFVGQKPNGHKYLPHIDIFALPSLSEGFPLSLLEAAAYGKKCVTSNLPIFIETFKNEVKMFDIQQPSSLGLAIKDATNDCSIASNIKKKYTTYYSPEASYLRHILIYQSKL